MMDPMSEEVVNGLSPSRGSRKPKIDTKPQEIDDSWSEIAGTRLDAER
jgi:hypothetical protein